MTQGHDPIFNENGNRQIVNRVKILGTSNQYPIDPDQPIYFNNSDLLISDFPASISARSSIKDYTWMKAYRSRSGTISGFKYTVLIHNGHWDGNMLVTYENMTTGAKAIYSNLNMFISGGETDYFDANNATKLFYSLKNWILGFGSNTYSISVTYPKSDKIFSLTLDDAHASDTDINGTFEYFAMKK